MSRRLFVVLAVHRAFRFERVYSFIHLDVEISHHGACSGLINGPLLLELDLPDTAAGRAACSTLAAQAARRWLGWAAAKNAQGNMDSMSQAGWLTSRMIYARDCQVRTHAEPCLSNELEFYPITRPS